MLRTLRSILVYVPSSECSMASVSAQASHPYKRMDSTVPLTEVQNKCILHNVIVLAITKPKIVKFSKNLTKLSQKN